MMIVCIWNTAEMLVTLDQNLLSRVFKKIPTNHEQDFGYDLGL